MVTAVTVTAHYTLNMLGDYGEILSVDGEYLLHYLHQPALQIIISMVFSTRKYDSYHS